MALGRCGVPVNIIMHTTLLNTAYVSPRELKKSMLLVL